MALISIRQIGRKKATAHRLARWAARRGDAISAIENPGRWEPWLASGEFDGAQRPPTIAPRKPVFRCSC